MEDGEGVDLELRAPGDVSAARRAVAGLLDASGAEDVVDAVRLAVSEVATNALLHGTPPVRVVATVAEGCLRVDVVDASPDRGAPQPASATASSGRGLAVVSAVADRWGIESRGAGKAVWLEFALHRSERRVEEVVLLGVPVACYLDGQEHLESTLRELRLLALSDAGSFSDLEQQTVVPLRRAMEMFRDVRDQGRAEAEAARSAGKDVVDLCWRLPEGAAEAAEVWAVGVAELARLAETGVLLTTPPEPEVADLRQWLSEEIVGQVRHRRPPRPFDHPAG